MNIVKNKPSAFFLEATELMKVRPDELPKAGYLPSLNAHYSVRLGNTTLVTGYPGSGKSYLLLNMQVALSSQRKWRHTLYTPEMGDPEEILITIAEIIIGKRGWQISEQELASVLPFIDEYFEIVTVTSSPSMNELCEVIKEEKGNGRHTFSIDNLNDLSHNIAGTQDIYFEEQHVIFNRAAKYAKMHGFMTAHPRNPPMDGINKPPPPDMIKGGSAHWSKGQTIMSIYRVDDKLTIRLFKIKPRIVGKVGEFEIMLDYDRNTYYEFYAGRRQYMFDQASHHDASINDEVF